MDTPAPGPEHETLARLAGEWSGTEVMHPSPWSPQMQERLGRISARVLGGFFMVSDYEQLAGDQVTFRGHGVYSWDPSEKHYVMYWFDSMGGDTVFEMAMSPDGEYWQTMMDGRYRPAG